MSRTRYEWTLVDFAAWSAGAVVVPIYETSSAEQVQWILSDSDAHVVVVETDAHRATVDQVRGDLPSLRDVITIEGGGLDALREKGRDVPDADLVAVAPASTDGRSRRSSTRRARRDGPRAAS